MTASNAPTGQPGDAHRGLGQHAASRAGRGEALVVGAPGELPPMLADALARQGLAPVHVDDADRALELALDRAFKAVVLVMPLPLVTDAASLLRFCGYGGPLVALVTSELAQGDSASPPKGVDAMIPAQAGPQAVADLLLVQAGASVPDPGAADGMEQIPGFAELRDDYLSRLPEAASRMSAMTADGDIAGLRGELHAIKGDAGLFGLPTLSRQAQRVLALLRSGRQTDALRECDALFVMIADAWPPRPGRDEG